MLIVDLLKLSAVSLVFISTLVFECVFLEIADALL